VDELGRARREHSDERRCAALLAGLGAPGLAAVWAAAPGDAGPVRTGLVWFVTTDRLLADLPPADRADVTVVVDAGRLGTDRALLAAAAPRLVAVVPPGSRSGGPATTLLGLLHRAAALVLRREPRAGRVVALAPAPRPAPRAEGGRGVGQAGA
jgi:hypothetical protein